MRSVSRAAAHDEAGSDEERDQRRCTGITPHFTKVAAAMPRAIQKTIAQRAAPSVAAMRRAEDQHRR